MIEKDKLPVLRMDQIKGQDQVISSPQIQINGPLEKIQIISAQKLPTTKENALLEKNYSKLVETFITVNI